MAERELSQFESELAMLLAGELGAARIPVSAAPQILGQGPIIPQFEPGYMLVPPGPPGSWGSFAQALGPSQDPRYAPALQAVRVLPPALLQAMMIVTIMIMMIRTNLSGVKILYKVSHLL